MPEMLSEEVFLIEIILPETWKNSQNALREVWGNILQDIFINLVDTMKNTCKICTSIREWHIPYWETHISHPATGKTFFWKLQKFIYFFLQFHIPMYSDLYHFAWYISASATYVFRFLSSIIACDYLIQKYLSSLSIVKQCIHLWHSK